jgi:glucokinase
MNSPKNPLIAALDIGGTKITASLINESGILGKVFQKVKNTGKNNAIPTQAIELITFLAKKIGVSKSQIKALGVSTCSPFAQKGKERVLVAPNLCGGLAKKRGIIPNNWTYIPLETELKKAFPVLVIKNDCVAAVAAERLFGSHQGENNLVYSTWSTGIGAGAFVDGHLIDGKDGNAPHFSHFLMKENGPQCGCSKTGHLEALSSGVAIARDYGQGKTTAEVFTLYQKKDPKALKVVQEAAKYFGRALSALNAILDAKVFILGGSVFANNQKILLPLVKKTFLDESFPALAQKVEILPTALGEHLPDLAALSLVIPESWIKNWQKNKPWKKAPKTISLD